MLAIIVTNKPSEEGEGKAPERKGALGYFIGSGSWVLLCALFRLLMIVLGNVSAHLTPLPQNSLWALKASVAHSEPSSPFSPLNS